MEKPFLALQKGELGQSYKRKKKPDWRIQMYTV
jgi:hypothetical protein